MVAAECWVEVWQGEDPSVPGRLLHEAGIEMRIAAKGWGAHGGGSLFAVFRKRKALSQLLVAPVDAEKARAVLKHPSTPSAANP